MSFIDNMKAERLRRAEELRELDEAIAEFEGEAEETTPEQMKPFLSGSTNVDWQLGGQIALGSVGFIVADPGVGKTTLIAQITAMMGAGRDVLGFRVSRAVPCLMVQAEGSRQAFRGRLKTCVENLGLDPEKVSWYIQPEEMTEYQIGAPKLEAMIRTSGAKFIVLDTLGYFHNADENDATEWKRFVMKPLRVLCAKYGCTFCIIHHPPKGKDDLRGSGAMRGDADFIWVLKSEDKVNPWNRRLYVDKNKYGITLDVNLYFDSVRAVFRQV